MMTCGSFSAGSESDGGGNDMDPAVFEKLGAVMSDPSIGEKINAIISGKGHGEEKPPRPEEKPCDGGCAVMPPCGDCCEGKKPCDVPPPTPPCPCRQPSCSQTVKNGRALLIALKPYMDESRCEKIDRILSAMKLAEVFGTFGKLL